MRKSFALNTIACQDCDLRTGLKCSMLGVSTALASHQASCPIGKHGSPAPGYPAPAHKPCGKPDCGKLQPATDPFAFHAE